MKWRIASPVVDQADQLAVTLGVQRISQVIGPRASCAELASSVWIVDDTGPSISLRRQRGKQGSLPLGQDVQIAYLAEQWSPTR